MVEIFIWKRKLKWNFRPQGKDKVIQKRTFWEQGDFGHAIPRIEYMGVICDGDTEEDSYLECSDHLRICKARNIFFNFKSFTTKRSAKYRNDIIHEGEVGGRCKRFDKELLTARLDEKSYLQSW